MRYLVCIKNTSCVHLSVFFLLQVYLRRSLFATSSTKFGMTHVWGEAPSTNQGRGISLSPGKKSGWLRAGQCVTTDRVSHLQPWLQLVMATSLHSSRSLIYEADCLGYSPSKR